MSEEDRVCGKCIFVGNCLAFQTICNAAEKIDKATAMNGVLGGINTSDLAKICKYFMPKTNDG